MYCVGGTWKDVIFEPSRWGIVSSVLVLMELAGEALGTGSAVDDAFSSSY